MGSFALGKVALEDLLGRGLLAPVTDDGARACDDHARGALLVELAQANPGAEFLRVRNLHTSSQ